MHKEGLKALGVLRPLPPAPTNYRSHNHWDIHLPTEHISPFRSKIQDLIQGKIEKIGSNMYMDRFEPTKGGADSNSSHGVFCNRCVEAALWTKTFKRTLSTPENLFMIINTNSKYKNLLIALHSLIQPLC